MTRYTVDATIHFNNFSKQPVNIKDINVAGLQIGNSRFGGYSDDVEVLSDEDIYLDLTLETSGSNMMEVLEAMSVDLEKCTISKPDFLEVGYLELTGVYNEDSKQWEWC